MTQKQIEEKLISLTPKELILAMVNGLRKRHTIIDMDTYGRIYRNPEGREVCYGCAATNALIEATKCEVEFATNARNSSISQEINYFEIAVNELRQGDLKVFNEAWPHCQIINPNALRLPTLFDDYTEQDLQAYERLAQDQMS